MLFKYLALSTCTSTVYQQRTKTIQVNACGSGTVWPPDRRVALVLHSTEEKSAGRNTSSSFRGLRGKEQHSTEEDKIRLQSLLN